MAESRRPEFAAAEIHTLDLLIAQQREQLEEAERLGLAVASTMRVQIFLFEKHRGRIELMYPE